MRILIILKIELIFSVSCDSLAPKNLQPVQEWWQEVKSFQAKLCTKLNIWCVCVC